MSSEETLSLEDIQKMQKELDDVALTDKEIKEFISNKVKDYFYGKQEKL